MRFALSSGSLYTYGLDRFFQLAAEAGFDGVEVLLDARFDTRHPTYLLRLMERYGLPILSLHAPFRPERLEGWPKSPSRSLAATAEVAVKVGAGIVVVHPPFRADRGFARWLLHDLAAWQKGHPNPRIALENMPLKWLRWWPFPLDLWRLSRPEEWASFPQLCLDTTHLAARGLEAFSVYERWRERIIHVHLSNARRKGRRMQEHHRLEDGDLDLGAFLGRLAGDGYSGVVVVELKPQVLEAEDEERVRAHLRRQLAFCRKYGQRTDPPGTTEVKRCANGFESFKGTSPGRR